MAFASNRRISRENGAHLSLSSTARTPLTATIVRFERAEGRPYGADPATAGGRLRRPGGGMRTEGGTIDAGSPGAPDPFDSAGPCGRERPGRLRGRGLQGNLPLDEVARVASVCTPSSIQRSSAAHRAFAAPCDTFLPRSRRVLSRPPRMVAVFESPRRGDGRDCRIEAVMRGRAGTSIGRASRQGRWRARCNLSVESCSSRVLPRRFRCLPGSGFHSRRADSPGRRRRPCRRSVIAGRQRQRPSPLTLLPRAPSTLSRRASSVRDGADRNS